MILGHRIRLDLNNRQRTWFDRSAGASRFAWNWGLTRWEEIYRAGETPSWVKLNKELNRRKTSDFPWLSHVSWAVTNGALQDLGRAFDSFFRRLKKGVTPGHPKFKKKSFTDRSFNVDADGVRFEPGRVRLPRLGWVRAFECPRLHGRIVSARAVKIADHWHLAIQVDLLDSTHPARGETQASVGVDLGTVDLAVLSDGTRVAAPQSYKRHESQVRRLDRELSRRRKGSRNREKTRRRLQRLHAHVRNIRRDVTHKLTTLLVRRFDTIVIEDLDVGSMLHGHHAKSVQDAALGDVRRQLEYKAKIHGVNLVIADRWFPSSRTCSNCGSVCRKLPLSVRVWTCSSCGSSHDRDVNAAINLNRIAKAHSVTACGEGRSGDRKVVKLPSVKQELGTLTG